MRIVKTALADQVAQAIEDQGLSMREAARRCGLSLGRLADVRYGRTALPQRETLQAIADGLGLSYPDLALAAYGVTFRPSALVPVA